MLTPCVFNLDFDVKAEYKDVLNSGKKSFTVIERSIEQHSKICIENSEDVYDAMALAKKLGEDIDYRIHQYTKSISKSTYNFVNWLKEDYRKKLRVYLNEHFDRIYEEIHGRPPEE